jgi:hypothetical protein
MPPGSHRLLDFREMSARGERCRERLEALAAAQSALDELEN